MIRIFLLLFFIGCQPESHWLENLPKPWIINRREMTEILPQFQTRYPNFLDRMKAFSIWQIGKPYQLFCLGEETGRDLDPIFRMDVSDCTVHILTVLASIQSNSWDMARTKIINLHYKPDENGTISPTYENRWHFTYDRIQDNSSTRDITTEIIDIDELSSVHIVLNQKKDGSEFLDLDWKKPTIAYYIDSEKINDSILRKLPKVAGVAFVKESYFDMGLVIAHEGVIIDKKNIIHASSEFGKTVKMDFMEYLFSKKTPRFDGVVFFSFHPLTG